jgi:Ser/Thr protein kinase RdoA (MazF antagonist)
MGACHGDFSLRNVLCDGGRAVGLIDFELASDGNVELELARLSRAEFANKPDCAAAFFAGYRESAYLAPGFISRLPLYLVGEAIFACSWTFHAVPEHFRESADWLAGFIARVNPVRQ